MNFKETDKEYYVFVNYPELYDRAIELGYTNVSIMSNADLEKAMLKEETEVLAKESGKTIVWLLYRPDHDGGDGCYMQHYRVTGTKLYCATVDLLGMDLPDGKEIRSFDEAVENFPSIDRLESILRRGSVIREVDYTNRCGNCHAYLGPDVKYCPYCGTERGKGKFEPYFNEFDCVYGPPVKIKRKCSACGYIWISSALGGDEESYCPNCGKRTIKVIEERTLNMFDPVGVEEPYDTENRPVLFTESQVKELLHQGALYRQRDINANKNDKYEEDHVPLFLDEDEQLKVMRKAGIAVPDKLDFETYPRTEIEGDQFYYSRMIVNYVYGNKIPGSGHIRCPHCHSSYVAALGYSVLGKNYRVFKGNVHTPTERDALIYSDGRSIDYLNPVERTADRSAYICLQCMTEFGKFILPKSIEQEYQADIAKQHSGTVGQE